MIYGRIECGVSVMDWWCRLDPAHSGGCVPRQETPEERVNDQVEKDRQRELSRIIEEDLDSWFDETHIVRGED